MAPVFGIDRFLNVHSASGPSFSPDGRFVSFLTNITGVSQLWLVPVGGGWPTQLTFTTESVRGGTYSPIRHELVYGMDSGGNERTQLYRLYGVGGGTDHSLGDGWVSDDMSKQPAAIHTFGGWSHDGERIAFSANREDPARFDIYVQTIHPAGKVAAAEALRRTAQGPGGYFTPVGFSPDDQMLLVSHMESNFNQNLFLNLVNRPPGHDMRLLTAHKGDVQYRSPHWSDDGKAVYCATTAGGIDLPRLARIDVSTGEVSFLETGIVQTTHETEVVVPSPKGRWLASLVNVGGRSQLNLADLKNHVESKVDLPMGVVSDLVFAPDDSKLAFVLSGPRHNPDVWLWDPATNKARQLTFSSRAGLPVAEFTVPELIQYKTFDGRMIPAWFYRPTPSPLAPRGRGVGGEGRLPPVIVYPHGGPEGQTRPTFNALFEYFVRSGYGVLAPNVRGSNGYGTAYMNLDNTTKRMDSVADLAHAVYWLRDHKQGDPKRVAVFGGSYGGFMVLASVTNYPDLYAAGIDVVGIANFVTFLQNTGAYRRAHRSKEYGNLEEHRAFLEKVSPIHKVDQIRCPMLVIHGANDPRVPIGEAEQIVAALKKRNVPVEYLRYEDEGHGLAKLKNRLDAYPKMVTFLDRYLK